MTATLHQPSSRSPRQSAEPVRAPFAPAHPQHNAILPPGLFTTPNSFVAPEMAADIPLAIPELGSFDQEELNDNPVFNELCPMPLIGALLLDRQLITRTQLDICLLLQAQTHPNLPIGHILVLKGYISQAALDHALGIQAEMRSSLNDIVSRVGRADTTYSEEQKH